MIHMNKDLCEDYNCTLGFVINSAGKPKSIGVDFPAELLKDYKHVVLFGYCPRCGEKLKPVEFK